MEADRMPRGGKRPGSGRPNKALHQIRENELLVVPIVETEKSGGDSNTGQVRKDKYAYVQPLKTTSPAAAATLIAQVINDQLQPEGCRQLSAEQAQLVFLGARNLLAARRDAMMERKIARLQKQIKALTLAQREDNAGAETVLPADATEEVDGDA